MKKLSIFLLVFGLITLILGIIANQSVIENFSIRAIKQISFTAILFGGTCTIYGVLGFAFSKQMSKVCSLRTTALSWALFYDLCKHRKWHKIQNRNRAGKAQGGLLPIIAY